MTLRFSGGCGSRAGRVGANRFEPFQILLTLKRRAAARGPDMEGEQQVQQPRDRQFDRGPAEGKRQIVERGRDQKETAEEGVRAAARKAAPKSHRDMLPGTGVGFVKDL